MNTNIQPTECTVLLTGATGYIGSHTWLALQAAGYRVVGVDNFSNSSPQVLSRLEHLSTRPIVFEQTDICDTQALEKIFSLYRPQAVIHFAAFKAVGESTQRPVDYYSNNLGGLLSVCRTMQRHNCKRFVFSSSATVYGIPEVLPITESASLFATNPYGQTKLMGEQILKDLGASDPQWQTACLRYFNPVGAHESGDIGEDPRDTPNNLMPYVAQVAVGRRPFLQIFGNDYPTPDGTGVRDYIHVMDLAEGHAAALKWLFEKNESLTVNLGTGRGYSVLEVVKAYEDACERSIPFKITVRRPGDVAACYADPTLAHQVLGWSARHDLTRMCADSWRWQLKNPNGYE